MNKNRRKENKTKIGRLNQSNNFQCSDGSCSKNELNVINGKSRVRIFGQLGLTPDDEYVLNCAALVNDSPIKTNVVDLDNNMDFNQPEYHNDFIPMITQATQVNFNFSKNLQKKMFKNKTAQCNCYGTRSINLETFMSNTEPEKIELKQCKSPLVVISVFPREDAPGNNWTRTQNALRVTDPEVKAVNTAVQSKAFPPKKEGKQKPERSKIQHNFERKIKSRSPSPGFDNVTKIKNKIVDTKIGSTSNREKTPRPLRQRSPDSDKSVPKLNESKKSKNLKQTNINLCNKSKFARKPLLMQQRDIRETNKEQVKKAIVNTFLNNLNIDNNSNTNKLLDTREDASRVTINIDGDKEKYDVLLEQRNFDTGLTVRKTVKPQKNSYTNNNGKTEKKHIALSISDNVRNNHKPNQNTENFQQIHTPPKLMATESRLNVKDSLEICHRREKHKSSREESNHKQNAADNNNYSREPNVLQTVKHYRGDNCSISDPNERDKEIRELLGILRGKKYEDLVKTKTKQTKKQDAEVSCCIECSQDLMTRLSFSNILPNRIKKQIPQSYAKEKHKNISNQILKKTTNKIDGINDKIKSNLNYVTNVSKNVANKQKKETLNITTGIGLDQNLVLNRKVQVFMQIDQFTKYKPLTLTKRQYEKVKNNIKSNASKKLSLEKKKRGNVKICSVSREDKKIRSKQPLRDERDIQTRTSVVKLLKYIETQYDPYFQNNGEPQGHKIKRNPRIQHNISHVKDKHFGERIDPRQIVSAMEIQQASVVYFKHASISSTHFGTDENKWLNSRNVGQNRQHSSVYTIFKGHRKMPTPNLGTSRVSLDSDNTNGSNHYNKTHLCSGDGKNKKPFLQRLISCLVMRSEETFDLKSPIKEKALPSRNSSVDSYYISTSLGAIEMTSSLYDTTASFYSNHTVFPVNKRKSFFGSVKEFLTNRRNQ